MSSRSFLQVFGGAVKVLFQDGKPYFATYINGYENVYTKLEETLNDCGFEVFVRKAFKDQANEWCSDIVLKNPCNICGLKMCNSKKPRRKNVCSRM